MLIIEDNQITDIHISSFNYNFPATNALSEHIKEVAKSTNCWCIVTLTIDKFDSIAILNTNAKYAKWRFQGEDEWREINFRYFFDYKGYHTNSQLYTATNGLVLWENLEQDRVVEIYLYNCASGEAISIGAIIAGVFSDYGKTQFISKSEAEEFDVVERSRGGSLNIIKVGSGRTYASNLILETFCTRGQYIALKQLIDKRKHLLILTSKINKPEFLEEYLKYGIFEGQPKENKDKSSPLLLNISTKFLEAM